jgi:kynureninase
VIPDFRGPDTIRLGVAPLYIGRTDVHDALARLRDLVARGEHRDVDPAPARVT